MLLLTSNLYCIVNLTQAASSGRGLPVNSRVPNFDIDVHQNTKYKILRESVKTSTSVSI